MLMLKLWYSHIVEFYPVLLKSSLMQENTFLMEVTPLVMYIHIFKHLFATGLKEKKTWKLWFLMKIEYMIHKVLFTPLPPLPPCFFLLCRAVMQVYMSKTKLVRELSPSFCFPTEIFLQHLHCLENDSADAGRLFCVS